MLEQEFQNQAVSAFARCQMSVAVDSPFELEVWGYSVCWEIRTAMLAPGKACLH